VAAGSAVCAVLMVAAGAGAAGAGGGQKRNNFDARDCYSLAPGAGCASLLWAKPQTSQLHLPRTPQVIPRHTVTLDSHRAAVHVAAQVALVPTA
jgi:hypothetical protein